MKSFDTLKQTVADLQADVDKFDKGNAAAGTRVRKGLSDIKTQAHNIRQEVTDTKAAN